MTFGRVLAALVLLALAAPLARAQHGGSSAGHFAGGVHLAGHPSSGAGSRGPVGARQAPVHSPPAGLRTQPGRILFVNQPFAAPVASSRFGLKTLQSWRGASLLSVKGQRRRGAVSLAEESVFVLDAGLFPISPTFSLAAVRRRAVRSYRVSSARPGLIASSPASVRRSTAWISTRKVFSLRNSPTNPGCQDLPCAASSRWTWSQMARSKPATWT